MGGSNWRLALPEFSQLAQKATDSVSITLDPALLAMAGRFLDANDPQDAATKEVLKGLRGIYVRSYTFDKDAEYRQADIDAVRSQLSAPGWSRLVETKSRKTCMPTSTSTSAGSTITKLSASP